jgi:hypothetical protein
MKLLFILFLALLIVTGCLPVAPSTPVHTEPPVAYIDSISAATVAEGQTVIFSGHGTDVGGTVVAYNWRSDRDGVLSKTANFNTSSLSIGNHYIFFKVQDNSGDWSREVMGIVNVLPVGVFKPSVNSFKATPHIITEGESTTLTWNVTDAVTVEILPDIGNVTPSGSRLVSPKTNTTYTLTATNKAGSVTETARVTTAQVSDKPIELFSVVSEEGYVDRNGEVGLVPKAGFTENSVPMQAFFSFDISVIPAGATIKSASIDLTNYIVYGQAFTMLGAMGVFQDQYGTLKSRDYKFNFTLETLVYTYSAPNWLFTSAQITDALQRQVDAKSPRFQIRVQFEKMFNQYAKVFPTKDDAIFIEFIKGKNKLLVTYK